MPYQSKFPDISIPECNILSWLFSGHLSVDAGDTTLWIDAEDPNRNVSAADALLLIKRLSKGLEQRRVEAGKALMVVAPNHIYVPIVYLASAGSGRVFTAANPSYTVKELVHQMKMIEPAILLLHPTAFETGLQAASKAGISQDNIFAFSAGDRSQGRGAQDWTTLLASEEEAKPWRWENLSGSAARNTPAIVNFSSGTTGYPKGVAITHYNIVANASQLIHTRFANSKSQEPGQDRWLAFLPWFHAYAQTFSIVVTCKLRQPVYTMSHFKFEDYVRNIEKHNITTLQLVPPLLVMLNKRPEAKQHDLSSVRYVMSAAAPLKSDLQNAVAKKLGAVVAQSWGMTETTCTGIMVPGQMTDDSGSVGYLLPNTEAMLVDQDGKEVRGGNRGELWIRGPQMMKEYIRNGKATMETLTKDGWLKTGDIAEYQDGKWWIVDRQKELIKVRGFQVAPAELEAILLEHDAVVDAAVVGIELQGEEAPRAYVVLRSGSNTQASCEAIKKFVADQVVKHKRLNGGVIPVDSVPRLQSGKVQRSVVKQWARNDEQRLGRATRL